MSGDAIAGEVIDRPRIDPRIARRWVEARRQEGRRRLRFLTVAGAVAAVLGLAAGSLYTPLLSARHLHVTVEGNASPSRILQLAGLSHHPLMLHVSASKIVSRLDADPWLGSARAARHWPDSVTISVAVRTPLAVVAVPGTSGWAEVDATGRILTVVGSQPRGMPALDGPGTAPSSGRWIPGAWLAGSAGPTAGASVESNAASRVPGQLDMAAASDGPDVPRGAAAALAVVSSLSPVLRAAVQSVVVGPGLEGPGSSLAMTIAPPRLATGIVRVNFGDGSQLAAKVQSLISVLGTADLSGVTAIDLTVPARPAALTGQPPAGRV